MHTSILAGTQNVAGFGKAATMRIVPVFWIHLPVGQQDLAF